MNRRDRAVVGGLVLILAAISAAVVAPAFAPAAFTPGPSPNPSIALPTPLREGLLGRPTSVNPLTARTGADRALVGLVFSGLLRLGSDGTLLNDLASGWTADEEAGVYTVTLRRGARWGDGAPVTADDVVFTVRALADPVLSGVSPSSWQDVTVEALDARTVKFTLPTPLGGFVQALTQPIAPAHLLDGVPLDELAEHPFGRSPVGSGPFRLSELTPLHAILEPAATAGDEVPGIDALREDVPLEGGSTAGDDEPSLGAAPSAEPTVAPTDSLTSPRPTVRPDRPVPYLPGIEIVFYMDAASLEADFRAGRLDAASGLPGPDAVGLAGSAGARLLRYPGSTLTTVVLNLRPTHRELRDERTRSGLLAALDRDALVSRLLGGAGARADGPIPPSSWAFDAAKSAAVAFDASSATKLLRNSGWRRLEGDWVAPGAKKPYTLGLLSPDETTSPLLWATAESVADDWRAFGLTVEHDGLPLDALVAQLREGTFTAAALDINVTLDPDLYPLFASTQVVSSGLNLSGVQDPDLDRLLVAARRPGSLEERLTAYGAVQEYLSKERYLLTLFVRDEAVVLSGRVLGPQVRQVAFGGDRYWDVLTWRLAADG